MDVYGYAPWQYQCSEELSNQIYAQQALANSVSHNKTMTEPHAMPVPSCTPWNVQGIPWGMPSPQPSLVQFTGQMPPTEIPKTILHCKRKPIDVEPAIPTKQLITEEKMAAHLSGLHISSDYISHASTPEEMMDVLPHVDTLASSGGSKHKGHKIVLADEIKKLTDEPLLPAALIERLEKPCMSLVVWKPKEDIVKKTLKEEDEKAKRSNETKCRRNGVLMTDIMDVEM